MAYVLEQKRSKFAVTPGWPTGLLGLDDAAASIFPGPLRNSGLGKNG